MGGHQVPRVIADFSTRSTISIVDLKAIGHFYLPEPDKWAMNDLGADFIYTGLQSLDFMLPNGLRQIQDSSVWSASEYVYPLFSYADYQIAALKHTTLNFISLDAAELVAGADEFDSTSKNSFYDQLLRNNR